MFWNTAHLPKITGTPQFVVRCKYGNLFLDARHVDIEIQQSINMLAWFGDAEKPPIEHIETMYIYASPKTWITVAVLHTLLGSEDPLDYFFCTSTTWINPENRLQPTDMCSWHRNQAEEELFICLFVSRSWDWNWRLCTYLCVMVTHIGLLWYYILYLFHEYPFGCQWLTPNLHQTVDIISTLMPICMVSHITTHVDVYHSPWGYITPEIAGKFPGWMPPHYIVSIWLRCSFVLHYHIFGISVGPLLLCGLLADWWQLSWRALSRGVVQ